MFVIVNFFLHSILIIFFTYFMNLFNMIMIFQNIHLMIFDFIIPMLFIALAVSIMTLNDPIKILLTILFIFILQGFQLMNIGMELITYNFLIMYLGAIIMLFLFIIMLLNIQDNYNSNFSMQQKLFFFFILFFIMVYSEIYLKTFLMNNLFTYNVYNFYSSFFLTNVLFTNNFFFKFFYIEQYFLMYLLMIILLSTLVGTINLIYNFSK